MRPLFKDFFRGLLKNKGKFISVFFIILLGAAFFSGLRSSRGDMLLSAEKYYDASVLMDYRIVGTAGLTDADLADLNAFSEIANAEGGYSLDVVCEAEDRRSVKLISLSDSINIPTVTEGRLPSKAGECLVDVLLTERDDYKIGDTISFTTDDGSALTGLTTTQFTISGFADLPQYMDLMRGTGTVGNGEIDGFVLLQPEAFDLGYYTEIRIELAGAKELDSFRSEYDELADKALEKIEGLADSACERRYDELLDALAAQFGGVIPPGMESLVPTPQWYVLGRDSIQSYVNFENDAERIASLGQLLPVIFFLVAALVSLTAMTRMVEEERQQIGTLKALGSGDGFILLRYLCYALLPTLTGSVLGVLIGEKFFPFVIMNTYTLLYAGLHSFVLPYDLLQGGIAVAASVLCTGLATFFACFRISRECPAQIMRPEAPKPGKRVLMERIPFLWKRLSFTQKSTVRNMFRNKKRFFMTIIGVAGCMGLILVGLGLHDSIMVVADLQFTEITHYEATVAVVETLSDEEREQLVSDISERDGVTTFVISQKSVEAEGAGGIQTLTLSVPQSMDGMEDFFTFRSRVGKKAVALTDEGAILSEKTARSLGVSAGDEVTFRNGDAGYVSVTVTAIYENYIGHYLFLTPAAYEQVCGEAPSYNMVLLRYADDSDEFQDDLGAFLLAQTGVQGISFTSTTVDWADDTLSSLNTIVLIVLGTAALLAFVVLYNLNSINIAERKRELATLKVLGFFDPEVAAYVYKENVLLTLIGIVLGIGVGILLHQYVIRSIEVDLIMFGRSIALVSYFIGAALTLAFSMIINLAMYRGLQRIDMIESLKSIE